MCTYHRHMIKHMHNAMTVFSSNVRNKVSPLLMKLFFIKAIWPRGRHYGRINAVVSEVWVRISLREEQKLLVRNLTLTLNVHTKWSYRSIYNLIKILRIIKSKQPFTEKSERIKNSCIQNHLQIVWRKKGSKRFYIVKLKMFRYVASYWVILVRLLYFSLLLISIGYSYSIVNINIQTNLCTGNLTIAQGLLRCNNSFQNTSLIVINT
jgi:hypothetical protein